MIGRIPVQAAFVASDGQVGTLTFAALVDDTLRLTRHTRSISPAFQESLTTGMNVFEPLPGDLAQYGSLVPITPSDVPSILERVRDHWSESRENERLDWKIALLAGWIVQRVASDVIGPVSDGEHARIYQDMALLRARSVDQKGKAQPEEITALFREIVPRTLTRFHTVNPDDDDAMGWILRVRDWRKEHSERMERYASAFTNPDPNLLRKYVEQPNFYDADEPVVKLAGELRTNKSMDTVDVEGALVDKNDSLYGRALARAVEDLLTANAYFTRKLDEHQLGQQLRLT